MKTDLRKGRGQPITALLPAERKRLPARRPPRK